ncbi:MAG: hypothetical protein RIF46_03100 [Cyclobacteriaceae bacterium]
MNHTIYNMEIFESQEDLEMALEISKKVKSHLTRLVYDESKVKYANNLITLDTMVSQCKSDLIQQAIAV